MDRTRLRSPPQRHRSLSQQVLTLRWLPALQSALSSRHDAAGLLGPPRPRPDPGASLPVLTPPPYARSRPLLFDTSCSFHQGCFINSKRKGFRPDPWKEWCLIRLRIDVYWSLLLVAFLGPKKGSWNHSGGCFCGLAGLLGAGQSRLQASGLGLNRDNGCRRRNDKDYIFLVLSIHKLKCSLSFFLTHTSFVSFSYPKFS